MSFEVKQEDLGGKTLLKFCGPIDEEAVFPAISDWGAEIFIDLSEVTSINSIGIRAWIMWFGELSDVSFKFLNCPKALVMQMNMVEGFLPAGSQVESLQVPFYCEDCDEEKEVLFEVGKQIQVENGTVKIDFDKSSICGPDCDPELDVNEAKFFRFLINQATGEKAA